MSARSEYPSFDEQYRIAVQTILEEGGKKTDPQGVGNLSIHGIDLKFDTSAGRYPLLGLRDLRGSRKAMAEELFWILRGETNVVGLNREGVHLWDQWVEPTRKEFGYNEGELGPIYGKQMRAFNAGGPEPVDQLMEVMKLLSTNPDSRRPVISYWNPYDINQVFISPCIRYLQFHHAEGRLGLSVVQGSADVPVGVPFDIAEYALFLRMVAHVQGMQPALLDYHLIDAHIYRNQIPYMEELISRPPTPQPVLAINTENRDILGFKRQDFQLAGYEPHTKMDIPVAL